MEVRVKSIGETRCMNPQMQKTKRKHEGREEVQNDLLHDLPDWLQGFKENLVDERNLSEPRGNPELGYRDTSSSSHEFPMEPRAHVELLTHFPKDPNCEICLKTKITRASCRRRANAVTPRAEKSEIWLLQITKFSVKKVNLVTIIDMPWWHKIWQRSG